VWKLRGCTIHLLWGCTWEAEQSRQFLILLNVGAADFDFPPELGGEVEFLEAAVSAKRLPRFARTAMGGWRATMVSTKNASARQRGNNIVQFHVHLPLHLKVHKTSIYGRKHC
jgi:hypothetical protein